MIRLHSDYAELKTRMVVLEMHAQMHHEKQNMTEEQNAKLLLRKLDEAFGVGLGETAPNAAVGPGSPGDLSSGLCSAFGEKPLLHVLFVRSRLGRHAVATLLNSI